MQSIAYLLAALAINEFVHNIFELWGLSQKLTWLDKGLKGIKPGTWPIHIDTKVKTFALHSLMLVLVAGLTFFTFVIVQVSTETSLIIAALALVFNYMYVVIKTDSIHEHIGRIISAVKAIKKI